MSEASQPGAETAHGDVHVPSAGGVVVVVVDAVVDVGVDVGVVDAVVVVLGADVVVAGAVVVVVVGSPPPGGGGTVQATETRASATPAADIRTRPHACLIRLMHSPNAPAPAAQHSPPCRAESYPNGYLQLGSAYPRRVRQHLFP